MARGVYWVLHDPRAGQSLGYSAAVLSALLQAELAAHAASSQLVIAGAVHADCDTSECYWGVMTFPRVFGQELRDASSGRWF